MKIIEPEVYMICGLYSVKLTGLDGLITDCDTIDFTMADRLYRQL